MKFLEFRSNAGFDKLIRMIVLILCLLLLGGFGCYCLVATKTLDGCSMIVTALISVAQQIVGFDWGSSAGSKNKDDLLGRMLHREREQSAKEN